ncbi:MAG: BamA/TamA family outer membrane protein, partial [Chitinivibrionales bacterium]|nr:BamA/TamA family outer membrane protein [Chitinivibrionales bacterium]
IFTLSLYLADLETGKVIKKLVRTRTNAHFDALRFTSGAGAWSPEGDRFAFIVFKKGDNSVRVIDIESLDHAGTYRFEEIESITGLAWSPDGDRLAITGTSGGISDLFIYNFTTGSLEKLTSDRYCELQPAWSPDGNSIVFATDNHPATNFDSLRFSRPQLGILNLDSMELSVCGFGEGTKHISPHFSGDGSSIFFVADPDGFSDIFRYSPAKDSFYRITRIATGVTGMTGLSPALSVAGPNNRLVFTVFENREYNIYTLPSSRIEEEPVKLDMLLPVAETIKLPPRHPEKPGIVERFFAARFLAESTATSFPIENYDADLSFLSVGRISAGATADRFGGGVGAGAHLLFSDALGRHILGVMAQINGSFADAAGQVVYQNRAGRLNWLTGVAHIPYRDMQVRSEPDSMIIDSQKTGIERVNVAERRTFTDRLFGTLELPLDINRRFELSGGYTYIWARADGITHLVKGDEIIDSFDESPPVSEALNLVRSSAAFVGDFSVFGYTSPIKGHRYRIEIEPTAGSLNYLSFLVDYRHYFHRRPLTVALRAFHFGRYFSDGESNRLSPLHLGYPSLVRGYEPWSFDIDDCESSGGRVGCAELDRLFGSRIAVGNLELRIPLLGIEGYSLINFKYLPLDLAAFADGGVAWTSTEYPEPEYTAPSRERIPVASAGVSTRLNLLGALILQFYYAYPFQRTDDQWRFGWWLAPGW